MKLTSAEFLNYYYTTIVISTERNGGEIGFRTILIILYIRQVSPYFVGRNDICFAWPETATLFRECCTNTKCDSWIRKEIFPGYQIDLPCENK